MTWDDHDLFFKVKFGHLGFSMGKKVQNVEVFLIKIAACSQLKVGRCNQTKWVNGYWRSRPFLVLGLRSLRFQNSNLFFSQTSGSFETKFHMKANGRKEIEVYSNNFGRLTKMATMTIYGKTLQKSSSLEPVGRLPWNLVCSIEDSGPSLFIQIMILGWPWPILCQG